MTETTVLPSLDQAPVEVLTEDEEAPDAAHIVTQADLIHSQVTGEAIKALCGKMWVPKRNPDNYPLCQACTEILNKGRVGG